MDLHRQVEQALAPTGPLAQSMDGFIARSGQMAMARAVCDVLEAGGSLVVEAGTGIGKTFAYLVPLLLSGERALVSTATKTLQDQLYSRDLPRLLQALGVPVKVVMLKGRSSYLCSHRLSLARHDAGLLAPASLRELANIEAWAQVTRSGDLSELQDMNDRSPVTPWVTSTRENCLGARCPSFQSCHVNLARREALAADVVVVNHHLFFADLAVRESGMAELLPTVRAVVFDEAHQLNDVGVQFLGQALSTGQLLDFCRDTLAAGLQSARGLVDWQHLAGTLEQAVRVWRMVLGSHPPSGPSAVAGRLAWRGAAPQDVHPNDWHAACGAVFDALNALTAALDTVSELGPDFVRLHERSGDLLAKVDHFAQACPEASVRWVDLGASGRSSVRCVESPLDIAEDFKTKRMGSAAGSEREQSWIFTSATLGHDERLSWFTQTCGLSDAHVLRVESPFDYRVQAALYVPVDFPRPADPTHSTRVAALAIKAVTPLGGRCLVLTTTLKALRLIGDLLSAHFGQLGGVDVLIQGQGPKRRLMERFRQAHTQGRRGCVLVASASFWEGFDVPGDALQLVIVDKLPFPPPNDPLVQARALRCESEGRSAFTDYFVPEAAVSLKQGAGRLIRQEGDRGVLIVCDPRLATMGYGKRILAALPPMKRLDSEDALMAALDGLVTRASTTAMAPS